MSERVFIFVSGVVVGIALLALSIGGSVLMEIARHAYCG